MAAPGSPARRTPPPPALASGPRRTRPAARQAPAARARRMLRWGPAGSRSGSFHGRPDRRRGPPAGVVGQRPNIPRRIAAIPQPMATATSSRNNSLSTGRWRSLAAWAAWCAALPAACVVVVWAAWWAARMARMGFPCLPGLGETAGEVADRPGAIGAGRAADVGDVGGGRWVGGGAAVVAGDRGDQAAGAGGAPGAELPGGCGDRVSGVVGATVPVGGPGRRRPVGQVE